LLQNKGGYRKVAQSKTDVFYQRKNRNYDKKIDNLSVGMRIRGASGKVYQVTGIPFMRYFDSSKRNTESSFVIDSTFDEKERKSRLTVAFFLAQKIFFKKDLTNKQETVTV
jgi:hypothetical protein